jgi:DNA-binding transcriptional regulator YhcF (GntR family)
MAGSAPGSASLETHLMEHTPPSVAQIIESLRGRILRALQSGALLAGDRLPSARDLAPEFGVDHRVVLSAYRELAGEDLVELRQRGGIYVRAREGVGSAIPPLPESWIADLFTEGLAREIPAPELYEWLRRCVETLRLRVAVITTTHDQAFGLCRELRDDFGMEADPVLADELASSGKQPLPIRRADLLLATSAHAERVHALGAELQKPVTLIELRPDLTAGEWALLLRQPVYAIVASEKFGRMLRDFFKDVPGVENLHTLIFGTDDLSTIPVNAPTYVTQRVRSQLAGVSIPGRILPAARTISMQSAREIFGFIVRSNLEALSRLG